jgi:RNA polymerase-binding transcription factor DksA
MPKKKTTSVKKKIAKKKTTAKKSVAKKSVAKKSLATKAAPSAAKVKKASVQRSGATAAGDKSTPIVFSLDDVEQLMASKASSEPESTKKEEKKPVEAPAPKKEIVEDTPVEKRVLGAASLADILGFNPTETKKPIDLDEDEIPQKWKKYYKLLIELRNHVSEEIDLHTADTLKHSSREDSGDLSSYGNHQADAGTDTFDRDFALSLVSSEQDALVEIEEAIQRIKTGSYGICEVTGKPIPAARLTAVPFARYSVEGQKEYEKNTRRKVDRNSGAGLFGDSTDAPKIASSDDDDDE